MRLYFENIKVGDPHIRCMFTIGVLPEEMEEFKKFIWEYCEDQDRDWDNIGEAIKKAENQLAPYKDGR